MKQSVTQYLIQRNKPEFVVTQSFATFMGAIQHVLDKDSEYPGANFPFEMFRREIPNEALPAHIPRETFAWLTTFQFGDAGGQYVIYETFHEYIDPSVRTHYYVEPEPYID
jgi:hypothetical protein